MFLDEKSSIIIFLISYILTIILCSTYFSYNKSICKSKAISVILLILTTIPFSYLCAKRSEYTGYDTLNYINGYLDMKYGIIVSDDGSFNFLFKILRLVTYTIFGDNIFIWLFLLSFLALLIFNYSFSLISKRVFAYSSTCLLFLLYLSPIMLDQSRQFISVALVGLAYIFFKQGFVKKFIFTIVISTFIHESSILFIIFPLLANVKIVKKYSYVLPFIFIISIFFVNYLTNEIVAYLPDKYEYIKGQTGVQTSGFGWIIDLFPLFFILLFYYKYRTIVDRNNLPLEICALSALPFRMAGYTSYFVMRLSYYGEVIGLILFCELLSHTNKRKAIILIIISILIFSLRWYIAYVYLGLHAVIPYSYRF